MAGLADADSTAQMSAATDADGYRPHGSRRASITITQLGVDGMYPGGIRALARRLRFGVLLLPPVIVLAYALHRGYRALPLWYVAASATTLVLGAGALTMAFVDYIRDRQGRDRYFYPRPATDKDLRPSARWSGTIIAAIGTPPLLIASDRYQAPWWIKAAAVGCAIGLIWILVEVTWATTRTLRVRSRRRRQVT